MSKAIKLPYAFQWSSSHPHIAWVDLYDNNVLIEVAVISIDQRNGDLYHIQLASLDHIDRTRLSNILAKRDSHKYPLWDLMSNTTLKNGMNALEYFNQMVKVRSVSGQIFNPGAGKMGVLATGTRPMSAKPQVASEVSSVPVEQLPMSEFADTAPDAEESAVPKRGPGRPPAPKQ